jgi:hypothetical protein
VACHTLKEEEQWQRKSRDRVDFPFFGIRGARIIDQPVDLINPLTEIYHPVYKNVTKELEVHLSS